MPEITMRRATAADVPTLVAMLLDDPLGATRESADDLTPYYEGFERVQGAPNTHLMVALLADEVVGTLTLTVLPGLSRQGASRANVEAVRVVSPLRNQGIGSQMMEWAMEVAGSSAADACNSRQTHHAQTPIASTSAWVSRPRTSASPRCCETTGLVAETMR